MPGTLPLTIGIDASTGIEWIVQGIGTGSEKWLFPLKVGSMLIDQSGNLSPIIDGHLQVSEHAGLPTTGFDTAGADTYTTILTAPRRCSHLFYMITTKDGILSLNGGVMPHFYLLAGTAAHLTGLDIPAASVIQTKNFTAGQNYANLYISIW